MYESARPPMKPRDIRRRAYALMRRCWLTLLIAAVLMSLFSWASNAVEAHGKRLAQEVAAAASDAYLADHPLTDDYADSIMWMADLRAEEAYDDAYSPWEALAEGLDLIGGMFSCVIAVGLYHGLLSALRGGECTPHSLLLGRPRAGTACWLALQRGLRIFGWMLLPLPFSLLISIIFSTYADFVARLLMLLIGLWATLHYALAEIHLADDPYESCTAREALRQAVDDADAFGVWQMCKVLWPTVVLFAVDVGVQVVAEYVPALAIPAQIFSPTCGLFRLSLQYTCFACIYDEIRQRIRAAEEAVPESEGLARARALATQK